MDIAVYVRLNSRRIQNLCPPYAPLITLLNNTVVLASRQAGFSPMSFTIGSRKLCGFGGRSPGVDLAAFMPRAQRKSLCFGRVK